MILRTQPAEACEPLAGTTKPERSTERNQTKRQSEFVVVQELVIFEGTLPFFSSLISALVLVNKMHHSKKKKMPLKIISFFNEKRNEKY